MRPMLALPLALLLVACGEDADPFNGPVQMAIDPTTNFQEAEVAEEDSLDRPVEAVLWRGRGSDGVARIRLVTPAYAQTAVDGAPVAGALVNAVGVGECPLQAWNPAAQTDEDGLARFWFEPGTRAGTCMAEIRYTDGVTRIVTDTAVAIVEPGPPALLAIIAQGGGGQFGAGIMPYAFPDGLVQDQYGNATDYSLVVEAPLAVEEDGRTLVIADSAGWVATGEHPFPKVPVRVVAGGDTVAVGELENESGAQFSIWWTEVALPFNHWDH